LQSFYSLLSKLGASIFERKQYYEGSNNTDGLRRRRENERTIRPVLKPSRRLSRLGSDESLGSTTLSTSYLEGLGTVASLEREYRRVTEGRRGFGGTGAELQAQEG